MVAILGSTGSIGTQTLEVVRANGDIQVLGISAGRNIKKLEEQAREFCPRLVAEEDRTEGKASGYRCKSCFRNGRTSGTGFWKKRKSW